MGLFWDCVFGGSLNVGPGFQWVRDDMSMKFEHGTMIENDGMGFGEVNEVGDGFSSAALDFEASRRRRHNAYREVLQSYDELQIRSENLKEAKGKILRY